MTNHDDQALEAKFMADIKKMLKEGSSNDVKIMVMGGEITANKDFLAARSDYFATLFSENNSSKFVEGQTNTIDMRHIEKEVMETVIDYLFSGKLRFSHLKLKQQLCLVDLLRFYLLHAELKIVNNHIRLQMGKLEILEVIEGFPIAKELNLPDDLRARFVFRIQYNLSTILNPDSHLCTTCVSEQKRDKSSEAKALEKLPYVVFKEILLTSSVAGISTNMKFFDLWFAANENKLEAKDLKEVFKDYREFMNKGVTDLTQQNRPQKCTCGKRFYK